MNFTLHNIIRLSSNLSMQLNFTNDSSLHPTHSTDEDDLEYLGDELLRVEAFSKWLLVVSIVISLISNSSVVICNLKSRVKSPYKYLIVNLAICDLVYTFFQIFEAHKRFSMQIWYFGRFLCKTMFLSPSSLTTSMFTMTFMAIERFITIVYPFRPRLAKHVILFIITMLWALAIGVHMPLFLTFSTYSTQNGQTFCTCLWPDNGDLKKTYYLVSFTVTYPIPILIILISSVNIVYTALTRTSKHNQKLRIHVPNQAHEKKFNPLLKYRKLFIMFACILLAFILTTTPNQALILWINFAPKEHLSFKEQRLTFFVLYMLAPLVHIHTITNPLIYSFSDEKFRAEIRQIAAQIWSRVAPQGKDQLSKNSNSRHLSFHRFESPALQNLSPCSLHDESEQKAFLENHAMLKKQNGHAKMALSTNTSI